MLALWDNLDLLNSGLVVMVVVGCLLTVFVVAALAFAIHFEAHRLAAGRDESKPAQTYVSVEHLLSPAERSYFGVLTQGLGGRCHVFCKVQIADLVKPAQHPSRYKRRCSLDRIGMRHVDFVLCDPATSRILGVVELDDPSPDRNPNRRANKLVDDVFAAAGIPLIRVPARPFHSVEETRELLGTFIGLRDLPATQTPDNVVELGAEARAMPK